MGRDGLHPCAHEITMAAGYWWDRLDGLGEVGGKEEQKREVLHEREEGGKKPVPECTLPVQRREQSGAEEPT